MTINQDKLQEFLGRFVTDLGATAAAGNVVIGHRLGLYKALAPTPASAQELAERTHTSPRYVAEWLRGQAAGGYLEYDAGTDTYSMTEEQTFALPTRTAPGSIAQNSARSRFPVSGTAVALMTGGRGCR